MKTLLIIISFFVCSYAIGQQKERFSRGEVQVEYLDTVPTTIKDLRKQRRIERRENWILLRYDTLPGSIKTINAAGTAKNRSDGFGVYAVLQMSYDSARVNKKDTTLTRTQRRLRKVIVKKQGELLTEWNEFVPK